jgi:hypothetical protein
MKYNTDINIIGSIPDYELIYRALPLLINNPKEIEKILVTNNEFDFRTEKSRKRFLSVLNSAFVNEENRKLNELVAVLIDNLKNNQQAQGIILFWIFSLQNQLFYELNQQLFLNYYYQGRAELPKEDVIAYIKDLISRTSELKGKWSEITIETIASKYLTILKKLNLVDGINKKKIKNVHLTDELCAVFVHIVDLLNSKQTNLLQNDFLLFSFIEKGSVIEKIKKAAKKDWINMNYTGTTLQVSGKFNSNTIFNGIYR